jgi:hypothetical protein
MIEAPGAYWLLRGRSTRPSRYPRRPGATTCTVRRRPHEIRRICSLRRASPIGQVIWVQPAERVLASPSARQARDQAVPQGPGWHGVPGGTAVPVCPGSPGLAQCATWHRCARVSRKPGSPTRRTGSRLRARRAGCAGFAVKPGSLATPLLIPRSAIPGEPGIAGLRANVGRAGRDGDQAPHRRAGGQTDPAPGTAPRFQGAAAPSKPVRTNPVFEWLP